jgi:hypothetical protein
MPSWARLTAVIAIALAYSAAIATGASASTASTTLPGFNQVGSVFRENGFETYRSTYVRCYTAVEWRRVARSPLVVGFYRGGSWIHVREATCRNAAKVLKGQVNYTNAVAISTLLHEAIHRQDVRSEGLAECLASWMTGHVVLGWTGSAARAMRSLGYSRRFARRLEPQYRTTDAECARIAVGYGIGNLPVPGEEEPEPPTYTPPPPPPPAEHLVGYEVSSRPFLQDLHLPYGHTVVRVSYSAVGPFDITVAMRGSNGQTERKYRVEGVGQFDLPLQAGYPATRTGGAVIVWALPDATWSYYNPGQAKIELRVSTR